MSRDVPGTSPGPCTRYQTSDVQTAEDNERTSGSRGAPHVPFGVEPERQEVLTVAQELATRKGKSLTATVVEVSTIPASNGHDAKSFTDPRSSDVSIDWVKRTLARALQERTRLDEIDRMYPR